MIQIDNLDKDIKMAQKLGYGIHYGAYKADHPHTRESEPEVIAAARRACRWCGHLFRIDRGHKKYSAATNAGCSIIGTNPPTNSEKEKYKMSLAKAITMPLMRAELA